jgi:hypothetical protein
VSFLHPRTTAQEIANRRATGSTTSVTTWGSSVALLFLQRAVPSMRPEAVTHAGAADTVTNGDGQEPERRELSIHDADSDSTSLSLSLPTPPASMTPPTLTPPLSIYRVSPTPSSASSSSSRAPVPFFPSVTQPSYIDPGRLAAVPDRPTGRTTFSEALASQPLRPWHASARFDSGVQDQIDCGLQDGQDLATQDPYLFPRLTKNER